MIVRPADVVRIKGKENTVKLFELIGIAKEVDTEQSKFLDKFRAAFANYESANFKEALDLFEAVQNHMPADALTGLYISRCRQLMKLPPDESWNGVMTFRVE